MTYPMTRHIVSWRQSALPTWTSIILPIDWECASWRSRGRLSALLLLYYCTFIV